MTGSTATPMLEELLASVHEPPAGDAVRVHGRDPVLPTPFRIGEFGAAAIAAAALQATRLAGQPQHIDVDVDAAAAGMRSSRYLTVDPPLEDAHLRPARFRTRDGRWIAMQRLFPHHVARQLEVLGCPADASHERVAAAVAEWDALELETAITHAGAVAGMVRTAAEWAAHPQSAAVASLPLVEITRIADGPPIPVTRGRRLLSGLRVLDATRVLAGPTCARTLAEHGADVLRISSPRVPDDPHMLMDTGHGKRSTVLDLASVEGRRALESLVRDADVFSQGYRAGALAALGFGAPDLAALRPGIVAVSISAYGRLGPWRDRRGFDSIVQAVSGMADELAVDGEPRHQPANPLDYITGYLGAFGALVALGRRAREGGSYHVEVSLARTGLELDRLPRTERDLASARPPELPPARLAELMMTRATPFGSLRFLAPIARLERTPGFWELPSVPADHDEPAWRSPES